MGLDMFLYGEKALDNGQRESLKKELNLNDVVFAQTTFQVGYWRKANQIHGWFVDNVQSGKDDCGIYYVSQDDLSNLLKLCKEALETKNPELIQPRTGFFFGSTDIDEYYWKDIKDTIDILNKALELKKSGVSIYYHSSW